MPARLPDTFSLPALRALLPRLLPYLPLRKGQLALSMQKADKKKEDQESVDSQPSSFCRDYWTRTSDLAPPRRVRYQLR